MVLTGGLVDKPPKPVKHLSTNSNNSNNYYTSAYTTSPAPAPPSAIKHNAEPTNCIPINSQTTSTTKTFLNNSLQVVQDLLPISQTSSTSSNTRELPLLSRISNEISTNTAVKELKRRLSLN